MISIQRLDIGQIQAIIQFNHLCFPVDFWKTEDWEELLADERAIYYALMDGEKIVGDAFIYNWMGEKDFVKLMNFAIHPDYRRQGLAKRLLEHVTAEISALGMKRFCGETRASNRAMQRTFERCGYRLNRMEENYYENPPEGACKYVLQM